VKCFTYVVLRILSYFSDSNICISALRLFIVQSQLTQIQSNNKKEQNANFRFDRVNISSLSPLTCDQIIYEGHTRESHKNLKQKLYFCDPVINNIPQALRKGHITASSQVAVTREQGSPVNQ